MKYIITIFFLWVCLAVQAQNAGNQAVAVAPRQDSVARATVSRQTQDSVRKAFLRDSIRNAFVQDSIRTIRLRDSIRQEELSRFIRLTDSSRYSRHPYLRFTNAQRRISEVRKWQGKEGLFYGTIVVILIFGLLRNAFPRYLSDLFRTYFRTTIKQRISKEQVANAPLPSLLFNILFLLSGALLAGLLLQHFQLGRGLAFWWLFLYCLAGLSGIYLIKFLVLKIFGWLLHAKDATNTYIFVVFATNKVLGILLLPFILGLAFAGGALYQVFFTLCLILTGGLFLYRFYFSFLSVHKLIKINLFHFLLYLFALEVVPLLLINKLLVDFFAQTP